MTTSRPNIVFILADDLGIGDVGAYGQTRIQTPALDRMAAEGMRFTQFYAGGPVCGPARACLMTGQSQACGFIKGNPGGDPLRENLRTEDVTVAERLKAGGYETACIGKWGLGKAGLSGYPLEKGFDYFVGYDTHVAAHDYYPHTLCRNRGRCRLRRGTYSHDVFTEEALSWIDADRDRPFFLYLAYTIPHTPYNPPDLGPYEDCDWPSPRREYAAMVTRMDRDIGRVLDLLKAKGLERSTLVLFASDNGPQSNYGNGENDMTRFFDSNGVWRGIKRDVYDGGIRIPFLAWWPGIVAPGTESAHVGAFQDLMPTLCELIEEPAPGSTDGISFLPTLTGHPQQQLSHDRLYWEFISMGPEKGGRQSALDVSGNTKAVRYGRHAPVALYDLNQDAGERTNLAGDRPELAADMTRYLDTVRSPSALWPLQWHDRGWRPPEEY